MKTTKAAELEAEVRAYMDECQRLRVQLEEVIKSKDTFADPEELKMIEDRFAGQEAMINGLRQENQDMLTQIGRKDDELRQMREYITDAERRRKPGNKELLKAKKTAKDKERECLRLAEQLRMSRM